MNTTKAPILFCLQLYLQMLASDSILVIKVLDTNNNPVAKQYILCHMHNITGAAQTKSWFPALISDFFGKEITYYQKTGRKSLEHSTELESYIK